MAIPSSYTRLQSSSPANRVQSGMLVNPLISRRPVPMRPHGSLATNILTLPQEPEDARLTGGTRSLNRRLLALNVAGSLAKRKPVASERSVPPLRSAVA